MGPLNPESLATFGHRLTTNRASAYSPAALGKAADQRPAQLRDPSVQLGDHRLAQSGHPERTRLQPAHRRQRQKSHRILRTPQEIRLRAVRPAPPRCRRRAAPSRPPSTRSASPARATTYQHTFEQQGSSDAAREKERGRPAGTRLCASPLPFPSEDAVRWRALSAPRRCSAAWAESLSPSPCRVG